MANCLNVTPTFNSSRTAICGLGPHSVLFSNTSTGLNSATSGYQWYQNGVLFAITTGTIDSVYDTITSYGTYNYMMVSFDTLSLCRDTAFHTVTITQTPTASFSFPSGNLCPNAPIPFTNSSTGTVGGVKYYWDFGDGGTDSSLNPIHSYGGGGTYSVVLTVLNSDSCFSTDTLSIAILNTVNINIGGDDGTGDVVRCLNALDTVTQEIVTFFNSSAPGITYTWDFGDGTPLVTQTYAAGPDTITHLFSIYGTFPVVCYAVDSNGCTATDTLFVTFDKFISSSFSVPLPNISGCTPHTVTPTNNSINATRYEWDFGDGSPIIYTNSMVSPIYTYSITGIYYIALRAINYCGVSTSTVGPITVSSAPDIDFNLSLNTRGCSPQIVTATDVSRFIFPANNFVWDMGNGNVYTGVNAPPQVYNTGVYTVKFIGSNGCGSDSLSKTIRIDSLPYAIATVSPLSGCSGMTVDGSAINFGYGTLSRWYVDGVRVGFGDTLITQSFTNISDSIQNHSIRYNVRNHCGSYDSTFNVAVHPEVKAILANTLNPICFGDSITHQSISSGDTVSYSWKFGDGTTSTLVGPHKKGYFKKGIDSVELKITGFCGEDSIKKLILIDSLPYTSILISPLEGCSPLLVSGTSVPFGDSTTSTWYKDGSLYFTGVNMPQDSLVNNSNLVSITSYRYNISNHCGSFDTTAIVKTHPKVLALMSQVNPTVCLGDSLSFRNLSTGDSLTFLWKFSNGDTSTLSGPHYRTFNTPGFDTTWLYVEGYCGKDSVFSITTVNKLPVANIIADVDSGCEDLSVNFTNGAPNGASYSWSFNGGLPLTASSYNPSVLFVDSGIKSVYLRTDSMGCSSFDTSVVVVFPGPIPSFTFTPLSGCSDLDVIITNTSAVSLGDVYSWNLGNGNIDANYSPSSQTYIDTSNINDSTYSIKLIIYTASGCSDSLTQNVTVRPLPKSLFTVSDSIVCEKETITFQNNSIGGSSLKWFFGDGDSSTNNTPSHSYDTAGTYVVSLIITTGWNCRDTSFQTILVNPNPIARFYSDSICFSFSTSFVDTSLFGPVTWRWTFGDGDSSSIQNPTHLYLNDTIYSVSLHVSNSFGCEDSVVNSVIVYARPVANFGTSTTCAKKTTTFYDSTSANPTKWFWDFGDGITDSVKNPNHVYLVGGVFPVQLIVENASGCIDTIVKLITISTVPQTYFTAENVCLGSPTNFKDSTVLVYAVTSYFWDFGDGNFSGLQNPNYQYLSTGTYIVSLTVTNVNGCDSTFTKPVTVFGIPVSGYTHDTVCEGVATTFIRLVVPSDSNLYIWNYGDGSSPDTNSSSNIYYTYATSGTYSVTLKIINTYGCEDSISQTIIVHPRPTALFFPQIDTICLGDSITFLNFSSLATNYYWDFGDGILDSNVNPTHTYSSAGLFQVSLQVENSFGCNSSFDDTVIVLSNPIADFIVDTVCLFNPSFFTNLSSGVNLAWGWSFGDGNTSGVQNPTHVYAVDSSFGAILTVTTPFGCTDSSSRTAVVLPIVDAQFNYSLACVGRVIAFSDSSVGNPSSWRWNFGDGNSSNIQNPSHTYSATGNFTVTLIVSNTEGCSDTISKVVFVNSIPVPNFTADTVCVGNIMSFNNTTSNTQPITSYFWSFGDGNNSTATNPVYTYALPGVYLVTLTVTNNGGCDSSITKRVVVRSNPVADFTFDTVCAGLATTFTDVSSGSPVSWKWNFGDFTPIDSTTGSVVSHSYATSGLYTASLNIKSGVNGCESQSIKYITVYSGVNASFSVTTPICEGASVQFVNNSSGGTITNTSWSFGDGNSSTVLNPIHTYASSGVYNVSLSIVSNQGCIDSDSSNVVVNALPVAGFDYSKNICLGFPTNFYDSSSISVGSISKWDWSFGDGNTDSIKNPFNVYNSPGAYVVSLQVTTDSGCSDVISKNIIINPESFVNFTYNSVCLGDSILFKDFSTIQSPDSIVSWFWEFGDGTNSLLQNPAHQYTGSIQSYMVKLTVTSSHGCLNDTAILVSYLPAPVFNYGPEFFGYCEDEIVSFYDSSIIASPSTIVSWEWAFGCAHKSFLQNPSHVFDSAGSFTIKLKTTSSDGCVFYDSLPVPLIIYPKPIADFLTVPPVVSVFRPEVYFDNKANGAVNYVWDFGDGSSGTDGFPTHMFPKEVGYYTITQYAFSAFGCVDSISKTIYVKDEFTMYVPNAFTPEKDFNNLFLVKGYEINNFHLKVFNRWGELLFESKDETEGWDGKYNGSDCPVGVYIYIVQAKDNTENDHLKKGHISLIR
ncbi:PKD domain-containing protein [Flavobacteriales bacterium]|nr:PKD domain-containing protein [Flavobacteriales bacterium]